MLSVFASCFFSETFPFSKVRPGDIFCGNCWPKLFACELLFHVRWRLDRVLGANAVQFRTMFFLWGFPDFFCKVRPEDIFSAHWCRNGACVV